MGILEPNKTYRLTFNKAVRKVAWPTDSCKFIELPKKTKVVFRSFQKIQGANFLEVEHDKETTWLYLGSNDIQHVLEEIPLPPNPPLAPGMMVKLYSSRTFFKNLESDHRCNPSVIPEGEMVLFVMEKRAILNQPMVKVMYKEVAGWIPRNYSPDEDIELWELFKVVTSNDP